MIDRGAWPGPVTAQRAAVAGECWLGPLGLLGRLELELGLEPASGSMLERSVALASTLRDREGFWSRSAEVDPIGTARRLLADRDELMSWGWRGEPVSERLASLWSVTNDAAPGIPDRLHGVITRLCDRRVDIAAIHLRDELEHWPALWRRVLSALAERGVRVDPSPTPEPPVDSDRDLARALRTPFAPVGDGSLSVVRPHGVLAAAEEVAAALAALPDLDGVVVVTPDAVLDRALARHGVPRVGADVPAPASAELLRSCLEAAFHPVDAGELHALVCADPGPVPRAIAARLAGALAKFPGRGHPGWDAAIARGLEVFEVDARDAIAARLNALLQPIAPADGALSIDQLVARVDGLVRWARGRVDSEPTLSTLLAMADQLIAIARLHRGPLDRAALRRMCRELGEPVVPGPSAELGLASVADPGALLGPARVVVWWDFTRDRAALPQPVRLSCAERVALAAIGVDVPAGRAAALARYWRRPLVYATEAVVLVCPQTTHTGDPAHLHPLWDELAAAMPEAMDAARLESLAVHLPARANGDQGSRPSAIARRTTVELRSVPVAYARVHSKRRLAPRESETVSALEELLGCPLAYVLHHAGRLRAGAARAPAAPAPPLYGELAHLVLADVFAGGALPREEAAARASTTLDPILSRYAETLLLAEHHADRATVREAIVETARTVAALLADTGAQIRGVEVPLAGTFGTVAVEGRADLVLSAPDHVLDFKWGRTTNRDRLRAGAAVQLAIYAELARAGAYVPGVAYLILKTRELFADSDSGLPGATRGMHAAADMVAAAVAALDARVDELTMGELVAPSATEDAPRSRLVDGRLELAPRCEYCDLDGICGRRGRT